MPPLYVFNKFVFASMRELLCSNHDLNTRTNLSSVRPTKWHWTDNWKILDFSNFFPTPDKSKKCPG